MSNSQNKKNEQQNNLCTTLTEQWKKGELESSQQYYVEYVDGRTGKANLIETPDFYGFYNNCSLQDYVKEVLAPVPSYEEWQDTENRSLLTTEFSNEIDELNEENQQLKELLKECRDDVNHIISNVHLCKELLDLKNKIDNAIGEKK